MNPLEIDLSTAENATKNAEDINQSAQESWRPAHQSVRLIVSTFFTKYVKNYKSAYEEDELRAEISNRFYSFLSELQVNHRPQDVLI